MPVTSRPEWHECHVEDPDVVTALSEMQAGLPPLGMDPNADRARQDLLYFQEYPAPTGMLAPGAVPCPPGIAASDRIARIRIADALGVFRGGPPFDWNRIANELESD